VRGGLIVHSPQCTVLLVEGQAALDEVAIKPMRFELALAPSTSEESACVGDFFSVNQKRTFHFKLGENHSSSL
jgi:hypothetical protein